jgi:AAA ATPase domain
LAVLGIAWHAPRLMWIVMARDVREGRGLEATASVELGQAVQAAIIGRATELDALGVFLGSAATGAGALVIEGEPGIGKTTVWAAGVEAARSLGYIVVAARPTETETQLSFAAVADLLAPVADEVLPALPFPQRRASHRRSAFHQGRFRQSGRQAQGVRPQDPRGDARRGGDGRVHARRRSRRG